MAHAGNIDNAWCSTGRIAAVRDPTLSGRHTARRAKGAAARATHETLKPAVDAGCLLATSTRRRPRVTTPEAIAYAWLPNERQPTLSRLIATLAPCEKVQQLGLPRCLGAADARRSAPARLLPHRLRVAVAANVQQCSAPCAEPSFVQADHHECLGGLSRRGCAVHAPSDVWIRMEPRSVKRGAASALTGAPVRRLVRTRRQGSRHSTRVRRHRLLTARRCSCRPGARTAARSADSPDRALGTG